MMRDRLRLLPLLVVLIAFPAWEAFAGCVASVCADGYTGCGCGPGSVECCRQRLQGGGAAPGFDPSGLGEAAINIIQQSLQQQQERQARSRARRLQADQETDARKRSEADQLENLRNGLQARERAQAERDQRDAELGLKGLGFSYPASSEFSLTDEENLKGLHWASPSAPSPAQASGDQADRPTGVAQTECAANDTSNQTSAPFTCHTLTCGGTHLTSVCCPSGHPYLNHCDCLCYDSHQGLDCPSYSACQYEFRLK